MSEDGASDGATTAAIGSAPLICTASMNSSDGAIASDGGVVCEAACSSGAIASVASVLSRRGDGSIDGISSNPVDCSKAVSDVDAGRCSVGANGSDGANSSASVDSSPGVDCSDRTMGSVIGGRPNGEACSNFAFTSVSLSCSVTCSAPICCSNGAIASDEAVGSDSVDGCDGAILAASVVG